ncbi:hypothetical protein GA0074695_0572 [Micromonospora viridifaciens]|uniref:Uncharacterized protein n=1 Tax=Micromonospora viridifaciens TaxID=1881 RepID=A0A1C4UK33_MICVI|nr:hypothetical protein GA0074695_0572 [Micromonospora viridifaciens]
MIQVTIRAQFRPARLSSASTRRARAVSDTTKPTPMRKTIGKAPSPPGVPTLSCACRYAF